MIEQIRSPHGDNYSYVIYDESAPETILVDPVAVDPIKKFLSERDLIARYLINTHGHGDHTSGNAAFQSEDRAVSIAHPEAKKRMGKADRTVTDGDTVSVGNVEVTILYTPGHTDGSICLQTEDALISGDTLFLAGCGNPKFGGDTRKLFETIRDKIRPLPDDLVLYPGHDYAQRNLEFVQEIDPENFNLDQKISEVRAARIDGNEPSSTIEEEKQYNPFLRYDNRTVAEHISLPQQYTGWDVFQKLRSLRNQW